MTEFVKSNNGDNEDPIVDFSILERMRDGEREEVIDGVTIRHSGQYEQVYRYDEYGNPYTEREEIVKMFDSKGNSFRTNCKKEEAEEIIKKYSDDDYEAVAGPKAPTRLHDGRFVSSQLGDDYIGIYAKKRES